MFGNKLYAGDVLFLHHPRHDSGAARSSAWAARSFKIDRVPHLGKALLSGADNPNSKQTKGIPVSIELKQPRIIVIEDRGKSYALTVARITKKQWLHYFEGILSISENQNGKRVDSYDNSAARLELVEQALVTATGYTLPAMVESIEKIEGWRSQLPISHRLGAANTLLSVSASNPSDEEPIVLGLESVSLDAVWGADESGVMRKFTGLRHNFKSPSPDQQRRLSLSGSRSRIIGGSRNGKTQWLGAQATLAELYDELIVSVEGYTVEAADPDRDQIIEYMDTYHKVAAVDLLFAPAAPKIEEEA